MGASETATHISLVRDPCPAGLLTALSEDLNQQLAQHPPPLPRLASRDVCRDQTQQRVNTSFVGISVLSIDFISFLSQQCRRLPSHQQVSILDLSHGYLWGGFAYICVITNAPGLIRAAGRG